LRRRGRKLVDHDLFDEYRHDRRHIGQRELRADSPGNGRSLPAVQRSRECFDAHARRHHRGQNRRCAAAAADVVNANANCAPITNALVYAWHCDKDGAYSGYNQPGNNTVGHTFCRGVQMTDSTGLARFTTIYPGWYSGRITHAHFRVYLGNSLEATSQLCFPQEITRTVYSSSLYAARGQNTSVTSFSQDGIFADGEQYQLCAMTENATTGGYDAALTIGIAL
jgi:hypothetical protein